MGKTLNQLYQTRVTELFAKIATHVMTSLGERSLITHLDSSSSFSFAGSYHSEKQQELEAIKIMRGYSKDHGFLCTLRCVFQVFGGIEVLTIAQAKHHQRLILNLRDEHRHLLKFIEPTVINLYLGDQGGGT